MNQLPEHDLPPARHRLLKEHLLTEIRREATEETTPARAPRTWLRPALAAGAVAAVAAVTFTLAAPYGSPAPTASKEAVALLEDAALAAEHADVPGADGIRDDQFVYIRSKDSYIIQEKGGPARLQPVHDREIWLSVDGTRWGLLEEDADGNEHVKLAPDSPHNERAAYYRALAKLPTDPDEMRDWLYRVSSAQVDKERPDKDDAAFVLFGDLIRESLMPPRVSAALYRAAAKIPGVEVVRGVRDSVGREGVAVTRKSGDDREELIFDGKTHAFLGERELDAHGRTVGVSAVLVRAVVDRAGQRP